MMSNVLQNQFKQVEEIIRESPYILLAGHGNPDGDSLGSMLGLHWAIKNNTESKTILYAPDEIPTSLKFLTDGLDLVQEVGWYPDLVIGFDYGDYNRLKLPPDMVQGARMITLDHHPQKLQRGEIKIIDTDFSSTSEIVYEFLKFIGWSMPHESLQCLLTGIITDTGALAHSNTSARTLHNVGELLQRGAPMHTIYTETFGGKSPKVMNGWGDLLQKIEKHPEENFVSLFVPFLEFQKYGILLDDLSGVISVLNLVADTGFSVFAVEYEPGKVKGSFRSEEFKGVDVSKMAQDLGGGGHKYAAGFSIDASMEEAQSKILNIIKKYSVAPWPSG